ncbi:MAG: hypothetical protein AB7E79_05885 [Rhodospirillaceae bacterium]
MGKWNLGVEPVDSRKGNDARKPYIHLAEFWGERVQMMQVWADYLDTLRSLSRVHLAVE